MATIYGGKRGPITEPKFSTPFTEGDRATIYGGSPRDDLRRVAELVHLRSVIADNLRTSNDLIDSVRQSA